MKNQNINVEEQVYTWVSGTHMYTILSQENRGWEGGVYLCSSAVLELLKIEPPASVSSALGLNICVTSHGLSVFVLQTPRDLL